MRRVFAGWPLGQLLAVAVIAATGIALLVAAVPRLYTAFRASRITAFACDDDSLRALEPGDWVRLTDCDTDMFHQSGLADGDGQRTHTLMPVREHETSVDEPSDAVLAVTREQMFAGMVGGLVRVIQAVKADTVTADLQARFFADSAAPPP